ncbi:MAG: response regulator [Sulfitobacter sp.]|jgi:CheY-like chemotaxis protein|uniref:response regulator n=1 Tax=Sulfitobacter sp. TaxID=1903071 RepID=UPI000C6890E7|nr:hypothetical protein [Roseobacter sp.]MBV47441.1 hypothetical protein [Roseobacter sp.]|tara:strand:+ start:18176 stop:18559 length:384 start_codon:yes stop_codon:yes gene_type:complete
MASEDKSKPAVLIVEDEPLIRMEAVDMIMDAGFKTYEAGSADKAIAMMELHDDIGILFTDIDMPGTMDGLKLAAYVRNRWPPVAIIIASGVVELERTSLPEGSAFFPKPYATSQITKTLHDIAVRLH